MQQLSHRGWGAFRRAISSTDIKDYSAYPSLDGDLGPHTVGPETVDLSILQRLGSSYVKASTSSQCSKYGRDLSFVALDADAPF
ncbi:hypothetical protein [Ralstonia soli]|uniref:Uncharacterized protein n=1 Tax=Ralstonia soli TaxID=2953896 RepID=A0ABT1AE54_9RALS|nr:hypothetical protein [Ralstonia soli]MCO5396675.1 hypothetical protein [Ralstonia soli]